MAFAGKMFGFCFRQVLGPAASQLVGPVAGRVVAEVVMSTAESLRNHFKDHSETLPKALASANDNTWNALEGALSDPNGNFFKSLFKSGDYKGISKQMGLFLSGQEEEFRKQCLQELVQAREAGLLTMPNPSFDDALRETACFDKYSPEKLHFEGRRFVAIEISQTLNTEGYLRLSELVKLCPGRAPFRGVPATFGAVVVGVWAMVAAAFRMIDIQPRLVQY